MRPCPPPHLRSLHAFSAIANLPPSIPPTLCHNFKWSKLSLNTVLSGKTDTRVAYTPDKAPNMLATEDPVYAALSITQKPSWVRNPAAYPVVTSSRPVSFEDPDGTSAQILLRLGTLYVVGHVITVKRWKQTSPRRVCSTPPHHPPPSS